MRSANLSLVTALGVALAAAAPSLPVQAQEDAASSAPAAPRKRKPAAPKMMQVQVLNQRDTTLVELAVVSSKSPQPVVIASGIGPGGKMTGKLPRNLGCVFMVSGTFDDESTVEVPSVNLCKDPRITLVE